MAGRLFPRDLRVWPLALTRRALPLKTAESYAPGPLLRAAEPSQGVGLQIAAVIGSAAFLVAAGLFLWGVPKVELTEDVSRTAGRPSQEVIAVAPPSNAPRGAEQQPDRADAAPVATPPTIWEVGLPRASTLPNSEPSPAITQAADAPAPPAATVWSNPQPPASLAPGDLAPPTLAASPVPTSPLEAETIMARPTPLVVVVAPPAAVPLPVVAERPAPAEPAPTSTALPVQKPAVAQAKPAARKASATLERPSRVWSAPHRVPEETGSTIGRTGRRSDPVSRPFTLPEALRPSGP